MATDYRMVYGVVISLLSIIKFIVLCSTSVHHVINPTYYSPVTICPPQDVSDWGYDKVIIEHYNLSMAIFFICTLICLPLEFYIGISNIDKSYNICLAVRFGLYGLAAPVIAIYTLYDFSSSCRTALGRPPVVLANACLHGAYGAIVLIVLAILLAGCTARGNSEESLKGCSMAILLIGLGICLAWWIIFGLMLWISIGWVKPPAKVYYSFDIIVGLSLVLKMCLPIFRQS